MSKKFSHKKIFLNEIHLQLVCIFTFIYSIFLNWKSLYTFPSNLEKL